VNAAVSSARSVRIAAEALLDGHPSSRIPLQEKQRNGGPAERRYAERLLAQWFPAEKTRPARLPAAVRAPLSSDLRRSVEELLAEMVAEADVMLDSFIAPTRRPRVKRGQIRAVVDALDGEGPVPVLTELVPAFLDPANLETVRRLLERVSLETGHVVRLLFAMGLLGGPLCEGIESWMLPWGTGFGLLTHYRKVHGLRFGLSEVEAEVVAAGLSEEAFAFGALQGGSVLLGWEPDAVWPYFQEHVDALAQALAPRSASRTPWGGETERQDVALGVVAMFPTSPSQLVPLLWETALEGPAYLRAAYQDALHLPDLDDRLLAVLRSRRQAERLTVVEWLGRRRCAAALEPLRRMVESDASAKVRSAAAAALEQLGEVPRLDRSKLVREAEVALDGYRGTPLPEHPTRDLPDLRWKDGSPVPPVLTTWMVLRAQKLERIEPDAWLRQVAEALGKEDAGALALWVVQAWLARDGRPLYTPEEAERKAAGEWRGRNPRWVKGQISRRLTPDMDRKGLLAVVAGCGDARAVDEMKRWIEKRGGERAPQCNALLTALSAMRHASADGVLDVLAETSAIRNVRRSASRLLGRSVAEFGDELDLD
jgi:hypothetical protein